MKRTLLAALALGAGSFALAAPAMAATIFVGSWTVDQGPSWMTQPTAYTGQEAAALLFGGSASDYMISTVGADPAAVNRLSWVSTWGGGEHPNSGTQVADTYKVSADGSYRVAGDTSAYVNDHPLGSEYTNYAFRIEPAGGVPEPATWALMIAGFGLVGGAVRSRKRTTVTYA